FQAEDGIRDGHVTGVQTCALPISDVPPHAVAEGRRAASSEVKSRSWADVAMVRYGCAASPGVDVLIDLVLSGSMRVGAAGIRVRSEERRVGKECRARGGT